MRVNAVIRGALATTVAVAAAVTPALAAPFGVNAHIPSTALLDEARDAGVHWLRIDVVWAFIEPEQDVFDWAMYDALVAAARQRGLRLYATFQATPAWATAGDEFSGVPRATADWQDFCYRVAKRYRGQVAAWGFWNEPNLDRFWDGERSQYISQILLPGIAAVRTADPNALVCGPDLAHLSSGDWDSWLGAVLRSAGDRLDVLTHHVYPSDGRHADVTAKLDSSPDYPWDPPPVRDVLHDNGWQDRPVWLTETGVQSAATGEAGQASFVMGLLGTWFHPDRSRNWLSRVFFYELVDAPTTSWGLLTPSPEHRRKAAFEAHRRYVGTTPVDDSEVLASSVPQTIRADTTTTLRLLLRNSGSTVWSPDTHQLVVTVTSDESWQVTVPPLDEPVHPDETVQLTADLAAPVHYPYVLPVPSTITMRMGRIDQWTFGQAVYRTVLLSQFDPPAIVDDPASQTASVGASVVLTVDAASSTTATYQWRRNTIELTDGDRYDGARGPRLEIARVDSSTTGDYDCAIRNLAGTTYSTTATVTAVERSSPRRVDGRTATGRPDRWLAWHRHRGLALPADPVGPTLNR
jgi:hypothetical protein